MSNKVVLNADFRFYRQGCWPEDYKAGVVEVDDEVLAEAKAAGLIEVKPTKRPKE